jgi:hypothetical protein
MVTIRAVDRVSNEIVTSAVFESYITDAQIQRVGEEMEEVYPHCEIEAVYE